MEQYFFAQTTGFGFEQTILGTLLLLLLGGIGWTWRTYVPQLIGAHAKFLETTATATTSAASQLETSAKTIGQVRRAIEENHRDLLVIADCLGLLARKLADENSKLASEAVDIQQRISALHTTSID